MTIPKDTYKVTYTKGDNNIIYTIGGVTAYGAKVALQEYTRLQLMDEAKDGYIKILTIERV